MELYIPNIPPAGASSEALALWVYDELLRLSRTARLESFVIPCTTETAAPSVGTDVVTFRFPFEIAVLEVGASLKTAQSSGDILTIDLNKEGVSILGTKLTIDNGETGSSTAANQPSFVERFTVFPKWSLLSIDIDQAGTGGVGLDVYINGFRTGA